jgi:hypothetical protein
VKVYRPLPPWGNPVAETNISYHFITVITNNGDPKPPLPAIHDVPKHEHSFGVMAYKVINL